MRGYANTATTARLFGTHTGTHRARKEGSHRFSSPPAPGKTGGRRCQQRGPGQGLPAPGMRCRFEPVARGMAFLFSTFSNRFLPLLLLPPPSLRLQSGGCACVLVHRVRRGAMKRGRCKSCSGNENTYRRSPWDGGPVQALKKKEKTNSNKTKTNNNNNKKQTITLKF